MEKIDLYKLHKSEYVTPREPAIVAVKAARYLTVEGQGEPDAAFGEAIGALFQVAYTIKMARKAEGRDYKVSAVEALWWTADPSRSLCDTPKTGWCWKLLVRVPEFIGERDRKAALAMLAKKGKDGRARDVRIETIREGKSVQALHVGPYSAEGPLIERMLAFAREQGLAPSGPHHEIYLSDPRRVPPARLRTILRQPVA